MTRATNLPSKMARKSQTVHTGHGGSHLLCNPLAKINGATAQHNENTSDHNLMPFCHLFPLSLFGLGTDTMHYEYKVA